MTVAKNTILVKMLDRLFAGLASGPNLNCRPHSSRQRVDWTQFARLQDISPTESLRQLLSDKQATQMQARVAMPKKIDKPPEKKKRSTAAKENGTKAAEHFDSPEAAETLSAAEQKLRDDWSGQQSLLTKMRGLAEDSREYEQDTGVHVLHVGFPLLSLPPGASGSLKSSGGTKRLLAPIAFIPVSLELRAGPHPVVTVEGMHDGADFLVPNEALFAWLERQTGKQILPEQGLGHRTASTKSVSTTTVDAPEAPKPSEESEEADPTHESSPDSKENLLDPWQELNELVRRVAEALQLPPCVLSPETLTELRSAPRTDDENPQAEIVATAVLGLFPMNNQGLLRDMQAMVADPSLQGPVQSFLSTETQLEAPLEDRVRSDVPHRQQARPRMETERLVTMADPCQAQAVRLARECQGLVVHGPPGTGKSQTITNMIGDHLVRGERVLFVCDKRTALDVVARRLEHLGLGSLCALIHDPQHDQRNLYKQVREQLEALASTKVRDRAESRLQVLDQQLQKSIDRLASAWSLVMDRDPQRGVSFHERMGEWLESAVPLLTTDSSAASVVREPDQSLSNTTSSSDRAKRRRRDKSIASSATLEPVDVALYQTHVDDVRDLVLRAAQIGFAKHPWRLCAGIPLITFLERPKSQIREDLTAISDCSRAVDKTCHTSIPPFRLPASSELLSSESAGSRSATSFLGQGAARQELADELEYCLHNIDAVWRKRWTKASKAAVDRAAAQMVEAEAAIRTARSTILDLQLLMIAREVTPSTQDVLASLELLKLYLETCRTWYAWIAFGLRAEVTSVLSKFGLTLSPTNAQRLITFLSGVNSRFLITALLIELTPLNNATLKSLDDESLFANWDRLDSLLKLLVKIQQQPEFSNLSDEARKALLESDQAFVTGLRGSGSRAEAIEDLRVELVSSELFRAEWLLNSLERVSRGESITDELQSLEFSQDTLVDILRIQGTLIQLPPALRSLTERTIAETGTVDAAMNKIRYQVLSDDIAAWLKSNPELQTLDGTRLNELNRDIRRLQQEKQVIVRERILDHWIGRQRERLLSATGTRLSGQGADLRRRLTTRGERAMRLRQVIAVGAKGEGGDPLFDLRPVWMASPETVAQIFPREALFDVVIFDEASQCRLEEALPVLTRAKRVVIAGDPKQLPPTRFFESAVITSDNATVETEQDLFEAHQSEIEDLLTAALSLDIQESYLDVHYRSRNADLVEFSNEQFYGSRLQAIPGHPKHGVQFAPITLYQVGGLYDERCNEEEATKVCRIVADLLHRAEPPSIGIACFNLTQRDLILEKLAELSNDNPEFAQRLVAARNRIGAGAFEGLFVKNLENVQGDERDHMIISTTYGLDKQGRFYKRFGPLGQAGGGRRLNVLITRARDEVHLVTSIPAQIYRSLPPVPTGQQPGGGWLLFAYLAYADQLAEDYGRLQDSRDKNRSPIATVIERPSRTPSHFAGEVARLAAQLHNVGSDVHWGNDGFCVDIAFHHPTRPDDRTLGLLCDGTRFQHADDPVEWDLFRTAVLEAQGWELFRCWTPEFFRDPAGFIQQFVQAAARIAEEEPDPEGIPVEPS